MEGDRPKFHVTNTFVRNWESENDIVINRGGTRSSKTYSICQMLANWLITGYIRQGQEIKKGVASVVRKYGTTLALTVERDFENVLRNTKLEKAKIPIYDIIRHHQTKRRFSFKERSVVFFGADNEQKMRGYGGNILYCNEANELEFKKEFFQLQVRTEDLTLIDFNPSDPHIWINDELEIKRAQNKRDVDVIVTTYKDNQFLKQKQIDEIEYLEETDDELWQVYGLGNYGKVTGLIYPNVTIIPEAKDHLKYEGYGQDFGYSVDEAAMVHCGVQNRRDLILDEIIYESGLTNPQLSKRYKEEEVKKHLEIFCDSAEPKSIAELKALGWKTKPAHKGPDSVGYGIKTLQDYHFYVTARSANIRKELLKYKWKVDKKTGEITNTPIDAWNHALDATRYWGIMKLPTKPIAKPRRVRVNNLNRY